MTKLKNTPTNSNSETERAIEQALTEGNLQRVLNKKAAARLKNIPVNIHSELSHLGGVAPLIRALNESVALMRMHNSKDNEAEIKERECIIQLRELLIKTYYGLDTWNLVEPILL